LNSHNTYNDFLNLIKSFSHLEKYLNLDEMDFWKKLVPIGREELQWDLKKCPEMPFCVMNTSGTEGVPQFIYLSRKAFLSHVKRGVDFFKKEILDSDVVANLIDSPLLDYGLYSESPMTKIHCGVVTEYNRILLQKKIALVPATVIIGFTNQVWDLLNDYNGSLSIRKIILTGGPLTNEFRDYISKKIPLCEIVHFYASMEFGVIGEPTSQRGVFKLLETDFYFEVEKDDGTVGLDGEGAILVTDMQNRSQPFVRYRLGDRVRMYDEYGVKMVEVKGRSDSFVKLYGDIVPKQELIEIATSIIKHPYFCIKIQHNTETLKDNLLILAKGIDEEKKIALENALNSLHGVPINILEANILPHSENGKVIQLLDERK